MLGSILRLFRREHVSYVTPKRVEEELQAIDPSLVGKYRVQPYCGGVLMKFGETTIISHSGSYGGNRGLYEVYPTVQDRGFRDLYDTSGDVCGWLTLREAVEIAEATASSDRVRLDDVVKKYFTQQAVA